MKKNLEKTLTIFGKIFVIVLCITFLINIVMPDHETSNIEQRTLQKFPEFSADDFISGEWNDKIEDWFSDQFIGKNGFVHLKYTMQKTMGIKKMDDVYLSKGSLIQETAKMNEEAVNKNLDAINKFYETNQINTMFLLAPNAVSMNHDDLPKNAFVRNQKAQMDYIFDHLNPNIARIDIRDTLKKEKDQYLYYKTDHHWTSLGAYYGASEVADYMKWDFPKIDEYTKYPLTYDFKGTLSKKTGSFGYKDEIDIYVPDKEPEYVVTYENDQKKSRTIYQSKQLDTADPYTVFLGGNQGLIQIDINNESKHHLLLFKDSYANALVPFLIPYCRTITIVDPRYYSENIDRIVSSQLITDILYVYNANTFVEDQSLMDVLITQE